MNGITIGVLAALLLFAAANDIKSHRISNKLVAIGAILAFSIHFLLSGYYGLLMACSGFFLGLVLFLPFYLFHALGAGDVKLMAVVGAFLWPGGQFWGAIAGTLIAGGILAVFMAMYSGKVGQMLRNTKAVLFGGLIDVHLKQMPVLDIGPQSVGKLPYAVAIATGTLGFLGLQHFGWL